MVDQIWGVGQGQKDKEERMCQQEGHWKEVGIILTPRRVSMMHWPQLGNSPKESEELVHRFSVSKTPI